MVIRGCFDGGVMACYDMNTSPGGKGRDMNDMHDWECELCRTDGRPEVITRSEFDRVIDECDVVPLNVVIVEDE